mgnify:CR=1 FL=1
MLVLITVMVTLFITTICKFDHKWLFPAFAAWSTVHPFNNLLTLVSRLHPTIDKAMLDSGYGAIKI